MRRAWTVYSKLQYETGFLTTVLVFIAFFYFDIISAVSGPVSFFVTKGALVYRFDFRDT